MSITLIGQGLDGMRRVAQLLPTAQPLIWTDQFNSPIHIAPGTLWGGDRLFVTYSGEVVFTSGNSLYRQSPGEVVRDYYLIALGQGAQRAAWLIPVAQAEMTFCMAVVGTLAGAVGTSAAITVGLSRLVAFYVNNKVRMDAAAHYLGPVLSGLFTFATRCPRLAWLLFKGLAPVLGQSAMQGISANDVAYFLGKLIGGAGRVPELSLRGLLVAARSAIGITLVLRTPGAVAHGAPAQAQALVQQLRAGGITISQPEAMLVASESCLRDESNQRLLQDLISNSERALPIIEILNQALSGA